MLILMIFFVFVSVRTGKSMIRKVLYDILERAKKHTKTDFHPIFFFLLKLHS